MGLSRGNIENKDLATVENQLRARSRFVVCGEGPFIVVEYKQRVYNGFVPAPVPIVTGRWSLLGEGRTPPSPENNPRWKGEAEMLVKELNFTEWD